MPPKKRRLISTSAIVAILILSILLAVSLFINFKFFQTSNANDQMYKNDYQATANVISTLNSLVHDGLPINVCAMKDADTFYDQKSMMMAVGSSLSEEMESAATYALTYGVTNSCIGLRFDFCNGVIVNEVSINGRAFSINEEGSVFISYDEIKELVNYQYRAEDKTVIFYYPLLVQVSVENVSISGTSTEPPTYTSYQATLNVDFRW